MISVIMSTYNRGKKISKSVESILNQTIKDFELIVCDDCSTDDTYTALEKMARYDSRIKLIKNKQNMGLQKSLNKCLEISQGNYIARMDDDDFSYPNRFEIQLKFLEKHPEYSFVGSDVNEVFDDYSLVTKLPERPTKIDLIKRNTYVHPSIMIRADIMKKVGGYSEDINHLRVEDYELWLRLYSYGYEGANIKEPLVQYSKSFTNTKFLDRKNTIKLVNHYISVFNLPFYYQYINVLTAFKLFVPYSLKRLIRIL
ncbi:MAG: glycosyltransferase [Staphylococcus epidermidis]|nr:glycosyltransferase [Staphylococcus epidermidis]